MQAPFVFLLSLLLTIITIGAHNTAQAVEITPSYVWQKTYEILFKLSAFCSLTSSQQSLSSIKDTI